MRLCIEAGCGNGVIRRGRCPEHAREANRRDVSQYKPKYNSKKWQITRRHKLFIEPLCEHPGCNRLAVDVHHANGHEDFYDLDGLESLCKRHHGEVTRAEQTGKGATL